MRDRCIIEDFIKDEVKAGTISLEEYEKDFLNGRKLEDVKESELEEMFNYVSYKSYEKRTTNKHESIEANSLEKHHLRVLKMAVKRFTQVLIKIHEDTKLNDIYKESNAFGKIRSVNELSGDVLEELESNIKIANLP